MKSSSKIFEVLLFLWTPSLGLVLWVPLSDQETIYSNVYILAVSWAWLGEKLRDFASNYEGLRPYWKLPPQREIAINLGHNTKQLTKSSRGWREAESLVARACWLAGREIGSYRNRCRCQWLLAWGQAPVDTWGAGEKQSFLAGGLRKVKPFGFVSQNLRGWPGVLMLMWWFLNSSQHMELPAGRQEEQTANGKM